MLFFQSAGQQFSLSQAEHFLLKIPIMALLNDFLLSLKEGHGGEVTHNALQSINLNVQLIFIFLSLQIQATQAFKETQLGGQPSSSTSLSGADLISNIQLAPYQSFYLIQNNKLFRIR